MKLASVTEDSGADLHVGDVVWIRGVIDTPPTALGDVKVRFLARPGHDEYARDSIAAIFLRRDKGNPIRRWIRERWSR
jgi:hypothetical protein